MSQLYINKRLGISEINHGDVLINCTIVQSNRQRGVFNLPRIVGLNTSIIKMDSYQNEIRVCGDFRGTTRISTTCEYAHLHPDCTFEKAVFYSGNWLISECLFGEILVSDNAAVTLGEDALCDMFKVATDSEQVNKVYNYGCKQVICDKGNLYVYDSVFVLPDEARRTTYAAGEDGNIILVSGTYSRDQILTPEAIDVSVQSHVRD